MAKRKIRKRYVFYVDKDSTRTHYVQSPKSGKMQGRRKARKGERSDQILNIRVKSPKDASGQIFGFLPEGKKRIPVRGDRKKRGTVRRTL